MSFNEKMRLVTDYERSGRWIDKHTCHGGRKIGKFLRIQSRRYVKNILLPSQRRRLTTSASFLYFVIMCGTKGSHNGMQRKISIKQHYPVLRNQTIPSFSTRVRRPNGWWLDSFYGVRFSWLHTQAQFRW